MIPSSIDISSDAPLSTLIYYMSSQFLYERYANDLLKLQRGVCGVHPTTTSQAIRLAPGCRSRRSSSDRPFDRKSENNYVESWMTTERGRRRRSACGA